MKKPSFHFLTLVTLFSVNLQALKIPEHKDFSKVVESQLEQSSGKAFDNFVQDRRVQEGDAGRRSQDRIRRAEKQKELERRRNLRVNRAQEMAKRTY